MDWLAENLSLNVLTWPEVIARLGLAIAFGFSIGLDRDIKNKPIDFRAYMIITVSACIIAVVGQELYSDFSYADSTLTIDLSRIIAGTLTGIGFLGAGAIIKLEGKKVVGTATGASIWASGTIGLALGFGFYGLALAGWVCILIILVLFGFFTKILPLEEGSEKEELS